MLASDLDTLWGLCAADESACAAEAHPALRHVACQCICDVLVILPFVLAADESACAAVDTL
jgi:hypothetical protein